MTDWQPTETAPRDGTSFLAWCVERPPWSALHEFVDVAKWVPGPTPQSGHFASRSGAMVSHWMPLPKPPSEAE